ncbi:hypothetical protein CEXT_595871 [Caerostris extrusa]|uniref:Uncharacterized protein n=1 Tax=Caerostris extrusa TaxID=172846 RepID=A0AAV4Y2H5_CAEEX|nr:hypothetical protein CEXT_595871 [Caerostris extrusa]
MKMFYSSKKQIDVFPVGMFLSMTLSAGMLLFQPFENGTVPPAVYPVIAGPLKGAFCDNREMSKFKDLKNRSLEVVTLHLWREKKKGRKLSQLLVKNIEFHRLTEHKKREDH